MTSRGDLPEMAPMGRYGFCAPAPKAHTASTGFGALGTDAMVRRLYLNDALIQHLQATYKMRARAHAIAGAGMSHGHVLIGDRAR